MSDPASIETHSPVPPVTKRDHLVAASLLASFGNDEDEDDFAPLTTQQAVLSAMQNKVAAVTELRSRRQAEQQRRARRAVRVDVA